MTRYISTLGGAQPVDLETAVLKGKAPDGGLFVPEQLPQVSGQQLESWKSLSYTDLAFEILSLFIDEEIVPAADLRQLIQASFVTFARRETISHHALKNKLVVQELFHGPTLSFKDVALGFVLNLFDYFLRRRGERRTLMVATSGDTGPAAGFASIGKSTISTWLFYPDGLITEEQARQMTTIMAPNVHAVAVTGCRNGSDRLDQLIVDCFSDKSFREEMCLSTVNSINWARVLTQIVHYFYGYFRNAPNSGAEVHFSVPCGAFGNLCAGSIAKRMGLPIGQLIIANNANDVLSTVVQDGVFQKQNIVNTLASAIDIAVPMNFWRHLFFSLNFDAQQVRTAFVEYDSTGRVCFSNEQRAAFSEGFRCCTVPNSEILATVKDAWQNDDYLLDPHAAVAVASAKYHREAVGPEPIVCLATAHPAKFPMTTRQALDEIPSEGTHYLLEKAMSACERRYCCPSDSLTATIQATMRSVESNHGDHSG